ncbi:phosphate ABC transporter substrate-binding/OmpA family protein [Gemmobacter serpentinus]|uniref:phosphate ABC transporter substrate-binding/OmpA family protein n=1 Tax=Gemmobacter serpentinus TaxID=2652247 RepID=UPI00124D24B4|nr:phosphate ABC transporter substrate-binding/OmpA family protein [Gemmobacter serpentinus]
MGLSLWRAAGFAALLFWGSALAAQDVTLTARDGSLSIDGSLIGFDGEFYRVDTRYGPLTVDGEGVICDGPGCPDLTATLAVLRITGADQAGVALLPGLFAAYAETRGLTIATKPDGAGFQTEMTDPGTGQVLAKIGFAPAPPEEARQALLGGQADLVVAMTADKGFGAHAMALDALVPIVARDNLHPRISTPDLAAALSGKISNWKELGGPDMPIALHALKSDTTLQEALVNRLGRKVQAVAEHDTPQELAEAVARDPWALAITGLSAAGPARVLPLTDSCGYPLLPGPASVKAEDYPLTLPIQLLTPRRRLPLFAREFLDFLDHPGAQAAVAAAGYVDRAPEITPMTDDGLRLLNAIKGAGADVPLEQLQHLADVMRDSSRSSLTFRFEDGSMQLDARSRENLKLLAQLLAVDAFRGNEVILAGFSDGSGAGAANMDLSESRAIGVATALSDLATDLPEGAAMPRVMAFGEALPMACDTTAAGRRANRRVEVWLRPMAVTGSD